MKSEKLSSAVLLLTTTFFPPQVANSQRAIAFDGIENARDMGGLVMQDGQTVRTGMLVRSGNLSQASDSDVATLKGKYLLTHVYDFRFEAEADAAPDRVIDAVCYTHLSTLPKTLVEAFASNSPDEVQADTRDLSAVLMRFAFDPKVQTMARQLYPAIVADTLSQRYYGAFLRGVLHAEGGTLWHCSQGKDRAGWASAFLLAALGADRKTIVDDFDLSNQSYARQVEAMTAKVEERSDVAPALRQEAAAFIRAMVGVSRDNFEATLDLIDRRYGSLPLYLENQLGFTKEEQQQLRAKYLTTQ